MMNNNNSLLDISKRDIFDMIWMSLAFIIIIILIIEIYRERDCINGKNSTIQGKIPTELDDIKLYTKDLKNFVNETTSSKSTWLISLLIGLIVPFIIIYLVKGKMPNFLEYIISAIIIFIASYFTISWNDTHFIDPNLIIINRSFDKILKEI